MLCPTPGDSFWLFLNIIFISASSSGYFNILVLTVVKLRIIRAFPPPFRLYVIFASLSTSLIHKKRLKIFLIFMIPFPFLFLFLWVTCLLLQLFWLDYRLRYRLISYNYQREVIVQFFCAICNSVVGSVEDQRIAVYHKKISLHAFITIVVIVAKPL